MKASPAKVESVDSTVKDGKCLTMSGSTNIESSLPSVIITAFIRSERRFRAARRRFSLFFERLMRYEGISVLLHYLKQTNLDTAEAHRRAGPVDNAGL